MPDNNKGIKQLWGYDLIDSKARNAISSTRSSLENDFQKKTDDTLGTTSKTIPGAINEIKDSVDNLDGKFSVEQTDTKYDMKYNGKTIANIGLTLTDDQIAGGDGSFNIDLTPYQTKNDDNLTTTDKTISGAINEVNTQCKDIVDKKIDNVTLSDNALTFLANNKNIKTITLPSTTGGASDDGIKTISSKVLTTVPASDIKLEEIITVNNISINKDRRYYIEFLGTKKLCSLLISEEWGNCIICSIGGYTIQAFTKSTNVTLFIKKINKDDTTVDTFTDLIIYEEEVKYLDSKYLETDLVLQNSISLGRVGDIGEGSSAIGIEVEASGMSSHAEGGGTTASGDNSHAEGNNTKASGVASHAEGNATIASGEYQHVQGKYNIEDTANKYAHIVGNGNPNTRANAHTLDWEGNAWYAGKLSQEGTPTEDKDLVTKKYVDNIKTDIDSIKTELGTGTLNTTSQDLKGAINEVFQNVSNGKQLIATAITDKGVTTSSDSTFQTMATNIKNISSTNINVEGFTTYALFETDETIPDTWIGANGGKDLVLSSDDFLNTFYDNLVTNNSDYGSVTKTALGKDESQTYTIYEYDFKPKNWNRMVLLSSGMHPYELPAPFGLAYFMKYVMASNNDAMKYIRENVRIKVIPIINPWGWNQNPRKYGTVNGVNINRNCDPMGLWESYKGNTTEWNQKGTSAFSENETKVLRNWLSKNKGAEFYIDCHTGFNAFPSDVTNALYYLSDSPIKTQIESALTKLNNWITSKYGVTGKANSNRAQNPTGVFDYGITDYAEKNLGIPGFTIEQKPESTAFGTAAVNEGADIKHYITSISTYVMELLLKQPEAITKDAVIQMKQSIIELNKDETNYINLEVSDYYRITNKLTNCTSSNNATTVDKNSTYNATITANNNYTISTINVTMGGVDITSTVVNSNIITIPQVTGDIIITAKATSNTPIQLEKFDFNLANINTGDTSITDSTNNKTLNIVGTDWSKNDDGSITFGSNSYLRYDNGLGTEDNKLFTLVLDMSANLSSSGTKYAMLWGDFNSDNDGIFFMCDTTKFYFKDFSKGTSAQVVYTGALDRNKYLLIYDGSQLILRTKTTILGKCALDNLTIPEHAKVYFGNTNTLSKNIDGKLYEIKWYNKVLSDEEIQTL